MFERKIVYNMCITNTIKNRYRLCQSALYKKFNAYIHNRWVCASFDGGGWWRINSICLWYCKASEIVRRNDNRQMIYHCYFPMLLLLRMLAHLTMCQWVRDISDSISGHSSNAWLKLNGKISKEGKHVQICQVPEEFVSLSVFRVNEQSNCGINRHIRHGYFKLYSYDR